MGELVSRHRDPLGVPCPKCGAATGKRCRTLTTNRSTDTHEARWLKWLAEVAQRGHSSEKRLSDANEAVIERQQMNCDDYEARVGLGLAGTPSKLKRN